MIRSRMQLPSLFPWLVPTILLSEVLGVCVHPCPSPFPRMQCSYRYPCRWAKLADTTAGRVYLQTFLQTNIAEVS